MKLEMATSAFVLMDTKAAIVKVFEVHILLFLVITWNAESYGL